ncbi:ABC transporter substrate-binding protein [Halocella sp. SP3-1]|uniref:ABC transporter substrate-binding protein n=1 Tax=Halocella sp. SP3-1 TaxID=2382161 RepID=UPI000F763F4A|nr:ABC transporter substrate-binding protein [Halocella sp. SP3-1]AZO96403.1 ABC transporter substrate-binding protein [Halocella sp. SP3-1]
MKIHNIEGDTMKDVNKLTRLLLIFSIMFVILLGNISITYAKTELDFYYPVGVAGPLAKVISGMVDEFNNLYPDIEVTPIYAGNYDDTMQKVQTAVMSGTPPDLAVLEISELHTMISMNATISLDKYIQQEEAGFLEQYFAAFLENGQYESKQYTIPFQRSTPVLYWNKEYFAEKADELRAAGLDPDSPPESWDELIGYGKVLTDRQKNKWGLIIPGGWNDWILEGFARQNNAQLMNNLGTKVYFNDDKVLEAVQLWYDMANKYKVMPPQVRTWAGSPADFVGGASAMLYNSTGALTYIKKSAPFDFGVAFMPKNKRYGAAVGGGDFHIFRGISKEKQDAAWEFIKFMTLPENAGHWSRESGYIAVRKESWELPVMKDYIKAVPEMLVAKEQLKYAHRKMSSVNYQQIREILTNYLDAVIEGKMKAKEAMDFAQKEAMNVLQ